MKKRSKKFLSLILALTLVVGSSLSVSATADKPSDGMGAVSDQGDGSGTAGTANSLSATEACFGWRFYITDSALWEFPSASTAVAIEASTQLNSLANARGGVKYYASQSIGSFDTATGMASLSGTSVPSQLGGVSCASTDGGGIGHAMALGDAAGLLNDKFRPVCDTSKAGIAKMKELMSFMGVSGMNPEDCVIVCEPLIYVKLKTTGRYYAAGFQELIHSFSLPGTRPLTAVCPASSGTYKTKYDRPTRGNIQFSCWSLSFIAEQYNGTKIKFDTKMNEANSGYVFYGPRIGDPDKVPEIPDPVEVQTDFKLLDYELNHVYPSVLEKVPGYTRNCLKTRSDIWTTDPEDYVKQSCSHCGEWNDYNTTKYYEISITDVSTGTNFEKDNAVAHKIFLNNGKLSSLAITTGLDFKRADVVGAYKAFDSRSEQYVADYSFNLIRGVFDGGNDQRVVSGFAEQTIDEGFVTEVLGLTYDVTAQNKSSMQIYRNSKAHFDVLNDAMKFSVYHHGMPKTPNYTLQTPYKTEVDTKSSSWTETSTTTNADGTTSSSSKDKSCSHTYNKLVNNSAEMYPFSGCTNEYNPSIGFTSVAYKYLTKSIPAGHRPNDQSTLLANQTEPSGYKYAVAAGGSTVRFYPEVDMLANQFGGDSLTSPTDVSFQVVKTIGEEARSASCPMIYIYKVTNQNNTKGTSYSDTNVGGTSQKKKTSSGKGAVFTAGGDFTVTANANYAVNLYGYGVDIVDPGENVHETNPIQGKGMAVRDKWGMSGNKEALVSQYRSWAMTQLDPNNYQADFDMDLSKGQSKNYNNFSATIGSFNASQNSNGKDYVTGKDVIEGDAYLLKFRHGALLKDGGYQALISQISADYGGSGEEIFENSGIRQAILSAIESDTDWGFAGYQATERKYENKSDKFEPHDGSVDEKVYVNTAFPAGKIGSSEHWYDEEVRTIVVRRYSTQTAYPSNIIAQDKADIGTTSGSSIRGSSDGKFYLTIYYSAPQVGFPKDYSTVYDPSTGNSNRDAAINSLNIIYNHRDVSGADFKMNSNTTSTNKRR